MTLIATESVEPPKGTLSRGLRPRRLPGQPLSPSRINRTTTWELHPLLHDDSRLGAHGQEPTLAQRVPFDARVYSHCAIRLDAP